MNIKRFRINIDADNIPDWAAGPGSGRGSGGWYPNYADEQGAVHNLSEAILRDMAKFLICHEKHGARLAPKDKRVSEEEHKRICRAALLKAADAYGP